MDLLCTCRVDPVHQSPRTRMYGYFTHGTDLPPRPYSSGFSLFPTAFAGCLPRPTSAAGCPVTRLSPRLWYYTARPSTDKALLATSLSLIGLLTPVPPGDSASPPEVTHHSSVPCHPQTPWCGG